MNRICLTMMFSLAMLLPRVRATAQGNAPSTSSDRLFQAIAAQDKALFDAYNACDLKTLATIVSDDLEFYHDKTGLAMGRAVFLDSIQKNICGKVTRELVPATLEVYSLAGYGAVEIGTHRFHHPGERNDEAVGDAKFVMLWRNQAGAWTLTRVISYDHAPLAATLPPAAELPSRRPGRALAVLQ